MQCPCGGETKIALHPKRVKKRVVEVMEYQKCGCGRQGPIRIYKVNEDGTRGEDITKAA